MEFTVIAFALRFFIGAGIGFIISLTGVGGGVLVIPATVFFLHLPPSVAIGTASLYSFATKVYAVVEHWRLKTIDSTLSFWFLIGAIPGSLGAANTVNRIKTRLSDDAAQLAAFEQTLSHIILGFMTLSMVVLIVNARRRPGVSADSTPLTGAVGKPAMSRGRKAAATGVGLGIGIVVGGTSIGGVLVVTVLIVLFGIAPTRTVGTSILIMGVLALVSAIVYGQGGQVDVPTAICMAIGSGPGVYLGSRCAVKLSDRTLQAIVIVAMMAAFVLILFASPSVD